jgi:hypothetical protein
MIYCCSEFKDLTKQLKVRVRLYISKQAVYNGLHKVRIYKEYHSVCPLVGIGTLPTPLSPASVPLPPEPGGGHTRLRVRGWGSPNSDDWRKSLALCLLCDGLPFC